MNPDPPSRDDLRDEQMRELSRQLERQGRELEALEVRQVDRHEREPDELAVIDKSDTRWHLDKKVPISIIAALFLQFLGGVWFMSKLESRVVALEVVSSDQRSRDERQDKIASDSIALLRSDLAYIRSQLDQLIRDVRKP